VCNRAAIVRFARGPHRIGVNELVVIRGGGKLVDHLLRDGSPARNANLLADERLGVLYCNRTLVQRSCSVRAVRYRTVPARTDTGSYRGCHEGLRSLPRSTYGLPGVIGYCNFPAVAAACSSSRSSRASSSTLGVMNRPRSR